MMCVLTHKNTLDKNKCTGGVVLDSGRTPQTPPIIKSRADFLPEDAAQLDIALDQYFIESRLRKVSMSMLSPHE